MKEQLDKALILRTEAMENFEHERQRSERLEEALRKMKAEFEASTLTQFSVPEPPETHSSFVLPGVIESPKPQISEFEKSTRSPSVASVGDVHKTVGEKAWDMTKKGGEATWSGVKTGASWVKGKLNN